MQKYIIILTAAVVFAFALQASCGALTISIFPAKGDESAFQIKDIKDMDALVKAFESIGGKVEKKETDSGITLVMTEQPEVKSAKLESLLVEYNEAGEEVAQDDLIAELKKIAEIDEKKAGDKSPLVIKIYLRAEKKD